MSLNSSNEGKELNIQIFSEFGVDDEDDKISRSYKIGDWVHMDYRYFGITNPKSIKVWVKPSRITRMGEREGIKVLNSAGKLLVIIPLNIKTHILG